ncbi:DNA-binding protein HU [subsurface metagenome]
MNKSELIDSIAKKTGLPKKDVSGVVGALQETISGALVKGDKVTLVGFGTFQVSRRKARVGINPKTGEKIKIPAINVPKFIVGKTLKTAAGGGKFPPDPPKSTRQ